MNRSTTGGSNWRTPPLLLKYTVRLSSEPSWEPTARSRPSWYLPIPTVVHRVQLASAAMRIPSARRRAARNHFVERPGCLRTDLLPAESFGSQSCAPRKRGSPGGIRRECPRASRYVLEVADLCLDSGYDVQPADTERRRHQWHAGREVLDRLEAGPASGPEWTERQVGGVKIREHIAHFPRMDHVSDRPSAGAAPADHDDGDACGPIPVRIALELLDGLDVRWVAGAHEHT